MSMSRSVLRHMVLAMVMSVVALGATAAENDHNQTVRNISEEKWVSAGAEHFTGNVEMRNALLKCRPRAATEPMFDLSLVPALFGIFTRPVKL